MKRNIRTQYSDILKNSAAKSDEAKALIRAICLSTDYTESGKRNAAATIMADLQEYLSRQKALVNEAADYKCRDMAALKEVETRQRDQDPDYQSLLSNTITLVPTLAAAGNFEYLKKRLEVFKDDPSAISAFRSVLEQAASECRNIGQTMQILECIPEDNSGKRETQLRKLQRTMNAHLDAMNVTVEDAAYHSESERTIFGSVRGGSLGVGATIDYMSECEDDDCTIYDAGHVYDTREEPVRFDFDFKKLNRP